MIQLLSAQLQHFSDRNILNIIPGWSCLNADRGNNL